MRLRHILLLILSPNCLSEQDVSSSHIDEYSAQRSREAKQLVGLGWRLMEASRNNLENHRHFGKQNVESMIEARSRFWNKITDAMERDQLNTADSRNDLANRFQRLRNMMRTAEQRDENRRQQNMEAIHHMMSSMGSMSTQAFNPRTYINFWRKHV